MAYQTNAFIRRNSGNKISVHIIYTDSEGLFKDFPEEGFVMAHTEEMSGSPMIMLSGEKIEAESWYKRFGDAGRDLGLHRKSTYWGMTISQLSTYPIWICRQVKNLFS